MNILDIINNPIIQDVPIINIIKVIMAVEAENERNRKGTKQE